MKHMRTVGIRALKQNASAVVAEAAAGQPVLITDRGRPVARLVPLRQSRIEELLEQGLLRSAVRDLAELEPPRAPQGGQRALTQELADMRGDERY
jgi:prevent-host-death family protein